MSVILVIILFLLFWYYRSDGMVVSKIDGNAYSVKTHFPDHDEAADILARLNEINMRVINHLNEKYAGTDQYDNVSFLTNNYNGDVLSEHTPLTTINTSFVLNKGDLIKLCLRCPKTKKIHFFQTLVFVNLHELSHLLDKQYGHKLSFWRGFKTILEAAHEIGVYDPVDYKKNPVKYCGMTITNNPYFNSYA